jgi:hypothetical protein
VCASANLIFIMIRSMINIFWGDCLASKYEEICAPSVDEFCYITDNTYFKEEVCFPFISSGILLLDASFELPHLSYLHKN